MAGVTEIYRIGGAQAIAALAYGTETIKPVSKIIGPGNAYVAAAKRQVFGTVGIDRIAGPSEVLVIADKSANPSWVAADFLAQAEHGGGAQSILVTTDAALADSVAIEVERQIALLPRADITRDGWQQFGAIILVQSLAEAVELANRIASNATPGTPLEAILHVAFGRWSMERCLEDEKDELGMSHFEVRRVWCHPEAPLGHSSQSFVCGPPDRAVAGGKIHRSRCAKSAPQPTP